MSDTDPQVDQIIQSAVKSIDAEFGDGYAMKNPRFLAEVMHVSVDLILARAGNDDKNLA